MDFSYLSTIIFLPALGAVIIAFIPGLSDRLIKWLSALFTLVPLALSIYLFAIFDRASGAIQFEEKLSWIPAINAHYHLGVDGISLPLVILMALLGFIVVLISWKIDLRPKEYFAWLLLLETSILGVFCSLDLLLFFLLIQGLTIDNGHKHRRLWRLVLANRGQREGELGQQRFSQCQVWRCAFAQPLPLWRDRDAHWRQFYVVVY